MSRRPSERKVERSAAVAQAAAQAAARRARYQRRLAQKHAAEAGPPAAGAPPAAPRGLDAFAEALGDGLRSWGEEMQRRELSTLEWVNSGEAEAYAAEQTDPRRARELRATDTWYKLTHSSRCRIHARRGSDDPVQKAIDDAIDKMLDNWVSSGKIDADIETYPKAANDIREAKQRILERKCECYTR